MGLFRKAGKKFEETKRTVLGDDDSKFQCGSCGEPLSEDFEYCPHCGESTDEGTG